jgi:glycosyltransferase involved in cell wall biosynthesis
VDLCCLRHEGDYLGQMPNCRVLPEDYLLHHWMLFSKKINAKNVWAYLPSLLLKLVRLVVLKLTGKDLLLLRLAAIGRNLSAAKEYDAAIAYAEGYPAVLVAHTNVRKKLVWIHNDYAFTGARQGSEITDFGAFSTVCCVSKSTQDSFNHLYPQYADKSEVIYNLTNSRFIREKAKEPIDDDRFLTKGFFTLVSIGRVCAQKNFAVIPEILSCLEDEQRKRVRWYIIGDGPTAEKAFVEEAIKRYHMEEQVFLLGNKPNPYPYLAKANLFVLTSVYESYPTVINEAKALNVPVLANQIPSAYEMVEEGTGIILPLNEMGGEIGKRLKLSQDELINTYPHAPLEYDFEASNEKLLQAFYSLLD